MLALVNWPFGLKEANPAGILSKGVLDSQEGDWVYRNRWQDKDDILVFTRKQIHVATGGATNIFPTGLKGPITRFDAQCDVGMIETAESALGLDFSGASGASALLVMCNGAPAKSDPSPPDARFKTHLINVNNEPVALMTVSTGEHPTPMVDQNRVTVGKQVIVIRDHKLQFSGTNATPSSKP